jgi:hypothetical protein
MVIPQNRVATFVPQRVVATEEEDDLYHRIEAGICYTIVNVKASQHRIGVIGIVNVDVASSGAVDRRHYEQVIE